MDQRLSLITLGVRDVARAQRFYEALGWHLDGGVHDDTDHVALVHRAGRRAGLDEDVRQVVGLVGPTLSVQGCLHRLRYRRWELKHAWRCVSAWWQASVWNLHGGPAGRPPSVGQHGGDW